MTPGTDQALVRHGRTQGAKYTDKTQIYIYIYMLPVGFEAMIPMF